MCVIFLRFISVLLDKIEILYLQNNDEENILVNDSEILNLSKVNSLSHQDQPLHIVNSWFILFVFRRKKPNP